MVGMSPASTDVSQQNSCVSISGEPQSKRLKGDAENQRQIDTRFLWKLELSVGGNIVKNFDFDLNLSGVSFSDVYDALRQVKRDNGGLLVSDDDWIAWTLWWFSGPLKTELRNFADTQPRPSYEAFMAKMNIVCAPLEKLRTQRDDLSCMKRHARETFALFEQRVELAERNLVGLGMDEDSAHRVGMVPLFGAASQCPVLSKRLGHMLASTKVDWEAVRLEMMRLAPGELVEGKQGSVVPTHHSCSLPHLSVTKPQPRSFLQLPDDILQGISEYCDRISRCAVTCTNSTALNSAFLGSVKLTRASSELFLDDEAFRQRIQLRVVSPHSQLHLQVKIKQFTDTQIDLMNSVRSVSLRAGNTELSPTWANQLSRIQTLMRLNLKGRPVSDLSPLAGLTNLIELDLDNTRVSDLSPLAGLTNLTKLNLSNTDVSDLSPLPVLTKLTHLYLRGTRVSDVSAFAGLKNLTLLFLSQSEVSDLSALAGLTNLTHLYLCNTKVSDVSAVAGLTNLTILLLQGTKVSKVSSLAGLPKLVFLNLLDTKVLDVSALKGISGLTILW